MCGGDTHDNNSVVCYRCNRRFHLNLLNSGADKDCGDAWLDDETMALAFACTECLAKERAEEAGEMMPAAPQPAIQRPRRPVAKRRYRKWQAG